jgi:hypothetical protein
VHLPLLQNVEQIKWRGNTHKDLFCAKNIISVVVQYTICMVMCQLNCSCFTLVEISSKPTVCPTFYRCFRLSHASDNKLVGPTIQPPVEISYFRTANGNAIFTDSFCRVHENWVGARRRPKRPPKDDPLTDRSTSAAGTSASGSLQ